MKKVTVEQFASNSIWRFLELFSKKLIALALSTILARLLTPDVYGVVALTTVFITFSDIFITNGFNITLIRKENVSQIDYSTVMAMSLSFSACLYIIFFSVAPFLAKFYETPEFELVLRTLTSLIFLKSISAVIKAKATRQLQFKKMSIISVVTSTIASIIGIVFAYNGMGVWALVAQQILANLFDVISLSIVFKWKYSIKVSIASVKQMMTFTIGVIGTSFLDFTGNNINNLVIGKAYSSTELGYFNRGNMYPETISLNMYNSITSVLLPTLASKQNDNIAMKKIVRKVISITTYIIFPMMFGLIAVSDKFVLVLLTEKWMPCVPIMICSCLYYSINPIRAVGYNVFYAKGESSQCVRIEIFRTMLMVTNLLVTILWLKKSIYILTGINVVIALIIAIITQVMVAKSINYSGRELLLDILPVLLMSIAMVIIVRCISLLPLSQPMVFLIQIVVGGTVYILLSLLTKNSSFMFLLAYIKKFIIR